ncbi:translation initiation factor IF-2 isoform X2 [Drosophila elegans]|uniref:translation initiation factor IF-2 isoform X2 n=1 Tax=Drosophila elegans TaxID=30023 RepID=UPI0007E5DE97|nr:translation initiation factor IF-2 isoform X2 [Drosophila elegans]
MLGLPLLTLAVLASCGYTVDAYSKYGRGCGDIGCLPTEECVITSDSCSYNQRDGKDCGNYPTCKRRSGGGSSASNSSPNLAANPSANPSGSVLNPGYPMHGLQPVNPYNPPFVFGQLPFYGGGGPTGTGGPPGGVGGGGGNGGVGGGVGLPSSTLGILGGGGGGLAPYGSNFQGYQSQHSNANMYNKPPPQYQNQNQQNPYNRRTQAHPSAAGSLGGIGRPAILVACLVLALLSHT